MHKDGLNHANLFKIGKHVKGAHYYCYLELVMLLSSSSTFQAGSYVHKDGLNHANLFKIGKHVKGVHYYCYLELVRLLS